MEPLLFTGTSTEQENETLVNCFITLFGLALPAIVDMNNLPYNKHYEGLSQASF